MSTMTNQSFATTLDKVKHKMPERQVLSAMNQHHTEVPELRQFLLSNPDVPASVRNIASSSGSWNKLLAKSEDWCSPDSLPARRLELSRAIVARVLRTPRSLFDADRAKNKDNPNWKERPADWDGGAAFRNVRMLTALIGLHQLLWLDVDDMPVGTPYTNLRNFAVALGLAPEGKSVKARLVQGTEYGLLYQERLSEQGQSGVWLVRSLNDRDKTVPNQKSKRNYWPSDAGLTPSEEEIAVALAFGDESNFAAALLLNADHLAFHYGDAGPAGWWSLLRVAAEPFTPRLSTDDERFIHTVRPVSDLDSLVSDEARAEHARRVAVRDAEKAARKEGLEVIHRAWRFIWSNEYLRWGALTEANADEWAAWAKNRLLTVPPDRQHLVGEILTELRKALPERLTQPGQSGRVLAYLEGNNNT